MKTKFINFIISRVLLTISFASNIDKSQKPQIINVTEEEKSDLFSGELSVEKLLEKYPEIKKIKDEDLGILNNTNTGFTSFRINFLILCHYPKVSNMIGCSL